MVCRPRAPHLGGGDHARPARRRPRAGLVPARRRRRRRRRVPPTRSCSAAGRRRATTTSCWARSGSPSARSTAGSDYDALVDPDLALAVLEKVAPDESATIARPLVVEQSNTSVVYDERLILKLFRRVHPEPNPDVEITEVLGDRGFPHVVPQLAELRVRPAPTWRSSASTCSGSTDAWDLAHTSLRDLLGTRMPPEEAGGDFGPEAFTLGEVTGRLHVALAEVYGTDDARSRGVARRVPGPARPGAQARGPPAGRRRRRRGRCDAEPTEAAEVVDVAAVEAVLADLVDVERRRAHAPHPRRPPPRPVPPRRRRVVRPRLRGRARPPGRRAQAAAVVAAARRRRHGAVVPLRRPHRPGRAGPRRRRRARRPRRRLGGPGGRRLPRRLPRTSRASTSCCRPPTRTATRSCGPSSSTRRSTRSSTSWRTGPTGSTSRRRPSAARWRSPRGDDAPATLTTPDLAADLARPGQRAPAATRTGSSACTATATRSSCARGGPAPPRPRSTGRPMRRIHDAGVFEVLVDAEPAPGYTVTFGWDGGGEHTVVDPWPFWPTLGDLDLHLIGEGRHDRLWTVLGAHARAHQGADGTAFAVWAPGGPVRAGRRRLERVGRPRPPDARARVRRACGSCSSPRSGPGTATSSRSSAPTARPACRPTRSPRPPRLHRPPPASSSGPAHEWNDDEWMAQRAAARPVGRAHVGLRGAPRLVDAPPRRAQPRLPTSWPRSWPTTSPTSASPTSSCCRRPSTPTCRRGATRSPATSPRRPATATPTGSARWSTTCTGGASA